MAQTVTRVIFHKTFKKHYRKRIIPFSKLAEQFDSKYCLFIQDRTNPILKDHALTGDLQGYRAYWVGGDIRVVYRLINQTNIEFLDVGSHNQVYS